MLGCRVTVTLSIAILSALIGTIPVDAAQISDEVLSDFNSAPPEIPGIPNVISPSTLSESSDASLPSTATPTAGQPLPHILLSQGKQQALIPDWSRITFSSFVFSASGSLSGSVLDRHWSAGQRLNQVMTLGDFQDSFNLEGLNLLAVNRAIGRSLDGSSGTTAENATPLMLSDFKLMQHQTVGSIVKAIPDLNQKLVAEVSPIAALLRPTEGDLVLATTTIGSLLADEPNLSTLRLDGLDLSTYKVSAIPGLDRAPFQAFKNWQQAGIDDIPGLKDMPWTQFPTPPNQRGVIGQLATVADSPDASSNSTAAFSGSNVAGYVDCQQKDCKYINLVGSSRLQGKRWFLGEQLVRGGSGTLADTNQGLEPTGRNIYGEAFKVVLTQIDSGGTSSAIYFHACESAEGQIQISCSPYGIGPFRFMTYANGDGIFLGPPDAALVQPDPLSFKATSVPATTEQQAPLVVNLAKPRKVTHKTIALLLLLVVLTGGVATLAARSLFGSKGSPTQKSLEDLL